MGDLPAYMNIGVIPTVNEQGGQGTGRIITFPNWAQHRVMGVYNDPSASLVATRKIVSAHILQTYPALNILLALLFPRR
jgi:hypothetical protein